MPAGVVYLVKDTEGDWFVYDKLSDISLESDRLDAWMEGAQVMLVQWKPTFKLQSPEVVKIEPKLVKL